MRLVLDSSVCLKWFLPEEFSDLARSMLVRARSGEDSFIAPDLLLVEVGHTLRKCVVGQRLPAEEAARIWRDFRAIEIELYALRDLVDDALSIALQYMGTFYDAVYVALAMREGLKVVTADEGMASAFAPLGRTVPLSQLTL